MTAFLTKQFSLTSWFLHFGGAGLILIGLLDNSAIPVPGGMDLLTTWLAAGRRHPWFYYTILATIGSAIGGYSTYRIGKKGGKEALEKKLPKKKVERASKRFSGLLIKLTVSPCNPYKPTFFKNYPAQIIASDSASEIQVSN